MSKRPDSTDPDGKLGDMAPGEFRRAAHEAADLVADYLESVESYPVVPDIEPGSIRAVLSDAPPDAAESMDRIFEDYSRWIEPNTTHWQHPGFMAYFASTACGPGILGEWLAAGLNSNVMFWKNAPAATEVEEVVVAWLRQMLGLPDLFDGMLTDTASVSSLLSLTAARHAVPGLDSRDRGLAGRPEIGRLRVYISTEAHSSIEKAAIVTGVGREGVRKIDVDDEFRIRPESLEQAIREDRSDGWLPFCVVGTLGTTSSTAIDPAAALADVCDREKLWLHLDAAYAGAAAIVPENRIRFKGWERADSIVFNPHKWMFTPFDASLLLFRKPELFRDAFNLVPEYLKASEVQGAHNFNEYGLQLGRRFRALKLWMQIRYFGVEGIAARIREHCTIAGELAGTIAGTPDWELLAPVPFGTVCFRYRPDGCDDETELDRINGEILEAVNRSGKIYLSHTRLRGRFTLRVVVGHIRVDRTHVDTCWSLLTRAAARCKR